MAALSDEKELSALLGDTTRELPVTREEMKKKNQLRKTNSIKKKKMKKQVWLIERQKKRIKCITLFNMQASTTICR